jgi:GT2 family glycosyltransferase
VVPSFSIIVPTFRRPDVLRTTLQALFAQDFPKRKFEVIVVDDDASPTTADVVRRLANDGVQTTIESQNRRGAATARNRGARLARGELLLFVDDDMIVAPDHLRRHLDAHQRHRDALIAGAWDFPPSLASELAATPLGRYRLELEQRFQAQARGQQLADRCWTMTALAAANLSVAREPFWRLGGFDEDFPVAGAEDQDFSQRAEAAGCQLLLDPAIRCLHNDSYLGRRGWCEREERSAKTVPFLARNHPAKFAESAYVRENRPIRRDDAPALVAKKLIKWTLSRGPALEGLHRFAGVAEAARLPDRLLRKLYRLLLGLHLFRGFRSTWSQAERSASSSGTPAIGTIES